ncbi:MAG TPA: hypothetical protein VGQ25_07525 [Gemmatimonadales bacterium]|jgi:hypothetical protein|nr:hypothetical protein [Gemmatimonadales bacterium]
MRRAAAAAALVVAAAVGSQHPRWAAFQGIGLGGPVDDVLAHGGDCRPPDGAGELGPGISTYVFAQSAFQYALPHQHQPRDSAAIRRALGLGTICRVALLEDRAWALAAAIDRRIVGIVVYFTARSGERAPADSVRRIVYDEWGRPTHHAPTLDTWSGPRYRSYLLVPMVPRDAPEWAGTVQLVVLDITACTAFDRRAHRAGVPGEAGEC